MNNENWYTTQKLYLMWKKVHMFLLMIVATISANRLVKNYIVN